MSTSDDPAVKSKLPMEVDVAPGDGRDALEYLDGVEFACFSELILLRVH